MDLFRKASCITLLFAIKVGAEEGSQGHNEFEKEVEILSPIHHPHMVMLIGACPEKGCIMYEYMANGSLEERLNCRGGTPPLPSYVRFRIYLEVATAFLFLHSRPEHIVHHDLKLGNILLDHHFVSKISDVGIAKLIPIDFTSSVTNVVMGTRGYMDPDYLNRGTISRQSDVYALGIVMLQLLTGWQPFGIADGVKAAVEKNQLEDVLDVCWRMASYESKGSCSCEFAMHARKGVLPHLETEIVPELESIQNVAGIEVVHDRPSSSSTIPTMPSSIWPKYLRI